MCEASSTDIVGGKVTTLVLSDLSEAFDTIDHNILLHCLGDWFYIWGLDLGSPECIFGCNNR